eukprot:4099176-Prymnesium_polylepis.1
MAYDAPGGGVGRYAHPAVPCLARVRSPGSPPAVGSCVPSYRPPSAGFPSVEQSVVAHRTVPPPVSSASVASSEQSVVAHRTVPPPVYLSYFKLSYEENRPKHGRTKRCSRAHFSFEVADVDAWAHSPTHDEEQFAQVESLGEFFMGLGGAGRGAWPPGWPLVSFKAPNVTTEEEA